MKITLCFRALVIVTCFHFTSSAQAKERKPAEPIGWGYVPNGPVEVRRSPSDRKTALTRLGRGALVTMMKVSSKGATRWIQVGVVELGTLTSQTGWVESSQIEPLPYEQFPRDADLLKQLGGDFLEDYTAAHTQLARYLIRRGAQEPALACFLGSPTLPSARLQIFFRSQGKLAPGAYLEFPRSELDAGITTLQVLDLLGDGNECLVTREPFRLALENRGVNLVIRSLHGGELKKLWEAPVEHRNLISFPPRLKILQPPEKNIGMPGTVTKGDVDFLPRGRVREPVWKGKVEFHAFAREEPVETLEVEKVCAWDGTKFSPLR